MRLAEKATIPVETKDAEGVVSQAYVGLAKYTARTRSYPGMLDGLKTSYRRTLIQSAGYRKLTKSATLVGETMKIHVHGDASVYGVLVSMACRYGRFPLFEGKGNFGGLSFQESASRYTEARLTDTARMLYLDLAEYADYEEGEAGGQEPSYLPSLLPYCFLAGSSGMTVGLPTPNIPALSPAELVDFCIAKLEGKEPVYPHLNEGKCIAVTPKEEIDRMLRTGTGKVRYRPIIARESPDTISVSEGTPGAFIGKSVEKLRQHIDSETVSFTDETSERGYRYVFSIANPSRMGIKELESLVEKALSSTVTYRIITERNGTVYYSSLDSVIDAMLSYLKSCASRMLSERLAGLQARQETLKAVEALRESGILGRLSEYTPEALRQAIQSLGFSEGVSQEVSEKPIRVLAEDHTEAIKSLQGDIDSCQASIDDIGAYLADRYRKLKEALLSDMKPYCTRTLSEEELKDCRARKVALAGNRIEVRKRGGVLLGESSCVLLAADDCRFVRFHIPATEDQSFSLPEGKYACMDSDRGKYFAVLYRDTNGAACVSVTETKDIRTGSGVYIRLREEGFYKPLACLCTDSEDIRIARGEKKKPSVLKASELSAGRKRFPLWVSPNAEGAKFLAD